MHTVARRFGPGRALVLCLSAASCLSAAACQPAITDDATSWKGAGTATDATPPHDGQLPSDASSGGADAASGGEAGGEAPAAPATPCLAVSLTTVTTNFGYRPRNVGVIWVTDGSGNFVKTLTLWGRTRMDHLVQWIAALTKAGVSARGTWPPKPATVDAITSATALGHGAHMGSWNCTDQNRVHVPDGAYNLCFEMTESNQGTPTRRGCVPFTKGSMAETQTPPDQTNFKAISLRFDPSPP